MNEKVAGWKYRNRIANWVIEAIVWFPFPTQYKRRKAVWLHETMFYQGDSVSQGLFFSCALSHNHNMPRFNSWVAAPV